MALRGDQGMIEKSLVLCTRWKVVYSPNGSTKYKNQCNECDYKCTINYQLRNHVGTHHRYKCVVTNSILLIISLNTSLQNVPSYFPNSSRTRSVVLSEDSYCQQCGDAIIQRRKSWKHLKIHEVASCCKCWDCGIEFNDRREGRRHLEIHSVKISYTCLVCVVAIKRRFALR